MEGCFATGGHHYDVAGAQEHRSRPVSSRDEGGRGLTGSVVDFGVVRIFCGCMTVFQSLGVLRRSCRGK